MRLTALEIFGFKSFADRTKFTFAGGITGVVGPNGCGKSNVVDAIRWVLGEQRSRFLRSEKMENVIFNGTSARRRAQFAEVSLSFENTQNVLPTEFASVTVTRRLHRDGGSEYELNGVPCRLRDIQHLFMDTGIGPDSYAIIELKMVDEILTNREQERSKFIEAAAGISKYKVRKRETLARLGETDGDLVRVEDLLAELSRQLRGLERQARRAREYFELKARYRAVSVAVAGQALAAMDAEAAQAARQEASLQDASAALAAETAQREARVAYLRQALAEGEAALATAQGVLNTCIGGIQQAERDKQIAHERLQYLRQRESALTQQAAADAAQASQLAAQTAEAQARARAAAAEAVVRQAAWEALAAQGEGLRQAADAARSASAEAAGLLRTREQAAATARRALEVAEVQHQSVGRDLTRQQAEAQERAQARHALEARMAELGAATRQTALAAEALRAQRQAHEAALAQAEAARTATRDAQGRAQRLHDAKEHEHKLMKSLVERLEGFPESVKYLKKHAPWLRAAPLVSDVIAAPEAVKVAIEAYLEPYLSYYVVPTRADAAQAVTLLAAQSRGRANFFILDELAEMPPTPPTPPGQAALEVVQYAPEHALLVRLLLGHVTLHPEGAPLPAPLPPTGVWLAQGGGQMQQRGLLGGGSLGLFEGKRLGRAQTLEALGQELLALGAALAASQQAAQQAETQLRALRAVDVGAKLAPVERTLIEQQRDLAALQSRAQEQDNFGTRAGQRQAGLEAELGTAEARLGELRPALAAAEAALSQAHTAAEAARQAATEAQGAWQGHMQRANAAQIASIQAQHTADAAQAELARLAQRAEELGRRTAEGSTALAQILADIETVVQHTAGQDTELRTRYDTRKALAAAVDAAAAGLAGVKSQLAQQEAGATEERRRRDTLTAETQALRDRQAALRFRRTGVLERLNVEFGVAEEDIVAAHTAAPTAAPPEAELLRLRERVQQFGEINPLAVEACEEMQARHAFITAQRDDLLAAKQALLETIAEIDEAATTRFLATFELVRGHFTAVFQQLFQAGDTCDLVLKDPEHPLESDLEIRAQPKGKRPLGIAQLSGGEKTLTATAFLFALYLIKPAPFCVFDEVDAPLDDANIDKFNGIIQTFSAHSQFILVTHNKRTMAAAHVIYGVTMEDTGVSRVLPVDLQALQLA